MSSITIENNHLLNSVLKLSVWTIKSKQRIFEMSSLSDECLYFIQSSTDQQKIWEFEYDERNFVIECDWKVVYLWYFRHCAMRRSRCSLINQRLTKTLSNQSTIDEDFIRSINDWRRFYQINQWLTKTLSDQFWLMQTSLSNQ